MKKVLFLFISIILCPLFVNAQDMTYEDIDDLPFEEENGVYYFNVPIVDPDVLGENIEFGKYFITFEEYKEVCLDDEITEEGYQEYLKEQAKYEKLNYYSELFTLYLNTTSYDDSLSIYFSFNDKNNMVATYCDLDDNCIEFDFVVNWLDTYDENLQKEATKATKDFDESYSIHGMSALASDYHYSSISKYLKNNILLYRYPELKKQIENNPSWDFMTVQIGIGGTPYMSFGTGYIAAIKDDVIYAIKRIELHTYNLIYVDKDEEGTIKEKAIEKIYNYFGGKVSVDVENNGHTQTNELWTDEDIHYEVNRYLNTKDEKYLSTYFEFKIDNKTYGMSVVEVSSDNLDFIGVETYDKYTGISVKTESYEVPFDTRVFASDAKEKDYVIKFDQDSNYEVEEVYDINLQVMSDKTYIRQIDGIFKVYIPVTGYKVGEEITIGYITSDSKLEETLEGKVVEINGKTYVEFETNHFSTYAILSGDNIENPNTEDNIFIYLSICIISGILLFNLQRKKELK